LVQIPNLQDVDPIAAVNCLASKKVVLFFGIDVGIFLEMSFDHPP
jgi:hypothetical protein